MTATTERDAVHYTGDSTVACHSATDLRSKLSFDHASEDNGIMRKILENCAHHF